MTIRTSYAILSCAFISLCACAEDGDPSRQSGGVSSTQPDAAQPEAASSIPDAAQPEASSIADSETVSVQEGGSSPDVSPALTSTIHAAGSSQRYWGNVWHRSPRYWKLNLAKGTREAIDLGTADAGAHSVTVQRGIAYVLGSDGNLWIVDKGVVSQIDLASEAGSKLVALGIYSDETTVHVLCREEANPSQIDYFFGHDSEFQHSVTVVEGTAVIGASTLSNGKLYLAGRWPSTVAYAVLEGNGWVSHSMMPDADLRGIYGMAVVGDTVHAAGDIYTGMSGVATYFRAQAATGSTMHEMALPMGGTITTDVAVDGDSVYLGGAHSSEYDFIQTRPVYFRRDNNGTAPAVVTYLEPKDGYETWVNAIQVRNKTVIAAGSDGKMPVVWLDYDADGINVQRINLEDSPVDDTTVLGLALEE